MLRRPAAYALSAAAPRHGLAVPAAATKAVPSRGPTQGVQAVPNTTPSTSGRATAPAGRASRRRVARWDHRPPTPAMTSPKPIMSTPPMRATGPRLSPSEAPTAPAAVPTATNTPPKPTTNTAVARSARSGRSLATSPVTMPR